MLSFSYLWTKNRGLKVITWVFLKSYLKKGSMARKKHLLCRIIDCTRTRGTFDVENVNEREKINFFLSLESSLGNEKAVKKIHCVYKCKSFRWQLRECVPPPPFEVFTKYSKNEGLSLSLSPFSKLIEQKSVVSFLSTLVCRHSLLD